MRKQSFTSLSSLAPLRLCVTFLIAASAVTVATQTRAADNELTSKEKTDGWKLLFNGKDSSGWRNNTDKPIAAKVENGAMNPHGSGGYVVVYKKEFGDFVLKCDVKMD